VGPRAGVEEVAKKNTTFVLIWNVGR